MKAQPSKKIYGSVTVRIPKELQNRIDRAVKVSGWSKSKVIRESFEAGYNLLEACDWKIEKHYPKAAPKAAPRLSAVPDPAAAPDLDPADPAPVFHLPFLGAVAAGQPVEAPRIDEELPVAKAYPPHHFIVEINGQSMEPEFLDGDRWIVDGREKYTPRHGAVCVVSDGSGSYLKRWDGKRRVFLSINPAFGEIMPEEGTSLQGYPVAKL